MLSRNKKIRKRSFDDQYELTKLLNLDLLLLFRNGFLCFKAENNASPLDVQSVWLSAVSKFRFKNIETSKKN